jgi:aminopeptidase N
MKRITYLLLVFSSLSFSQVEEFKSEHIVEAEMKSNAKKFNFKSNPNTQNYDLTYGKLEFTVNPSSNNINGKVTLTFKALSDMNTVTFDLTNQLTVSSVKKELSNLSFVQNTNNELVITLPSVLTTGNSETVEINYSGAPATDQGAFTIGSHGSPSKPVLYTLSEPYGARDWWPCKQDLTDKIDSIDVYITAPSQYLSVSNGLEISRNISGLNATSHFKHSYPIPAYLVAIAVTNYTKKNTGTAGTNVIFPIIDYIYPESDTPFNATNLGRTAPIINFFESKIGPYPYNREKYGHTQWGWGGGMEHATNSFMVNYGRELLSHELAHQWFGDKITCGTWKDIWLNEGLTEYMSGCVIENFDGETSFVNWKAGKINNITSVPTGNLYLYDSQLTNVNRIFSGRITYNKGSMVANMLRYVMGDANYFQALQNYLSDPNLAYSYAITSQFQSHLEAVYGSSLQEFFNDWIYKEGYPSYQITAYNSAANEAKVRIEQTQSITDPLQVGYVDYFEMPVPVRLTLNDGSHLDVRLDNTFNGQLYTVSLPVGKTITGILFDPKNDIISKDNTATLGIIDFELSKSTNLYPNPSNERITVQLPDFAFLNKVNFINQLGQTVMSSNSNTIDVTNLKVGIYHVIIETSEGLAHKKFVRN